ncbi:MAG: CHAT domain-containing protein, partial [Leptolyngbyaceae cyanobacterium]
MVDPNAAILYPVILGDRLEVILAYPDVAHSNQQRFVQFSTPVQSKEVDDLVFKFRRQLADPIVRENRRLTTASQLYDWLIRPAQEYLNSATASPIQTLVFVLDGSLQNLPMAALWDRDNEEYLLDQYAIAIAPSLQLVDPSPMTRPIKLLAAGTTESLSNPLKDGQFFTKLPGVERELEAIATVLPANVLFNETFTQESLTQEIQANEFSVIHIATHGVFSSDSARTFIAVPSADPESGKPDALFADELDVLLRDRTANQRTANRQPLELLVLSACQTAQGDNRATLGIAGLSIRAGARSTLATLWSVYD